MNIDLLRQAFYHGFILGKYRASEFPNNPFKQWLKQLNIQNPPTK